MRIAYLTRSLDAGGAERQLILQAAGLASRGHEVLVLTFYAGGALEEFAREKRVTVQTIGKAGRWSVLPFLRRLVGAIREFDPAVVHGMLVMPNVVLALAKPLLGRARIVWGVRASTIDWSLFGWAERAAFNLSRALSHVADGIIANSAAGKAYHVRMGYPARNFRTIANGIDTGAFAPDPTAGAMVRGEWGIQDDELVIGVSARLDPLKGHELLIKALPSVRRHHPGVRVVCVGEGSNKAREELLHLADGLGVGSLVQFIGGRRDMNAVYNAFDILCAPSLSEGFSNVIAEAMACGTPCVVSDVGDSAMIVGDTGQVVRPGRSTELADGINEFLASPFREAGPSARARIEGIAGIERMISETEYALAEIVR